MIEIKVDVNRAIRSLNTYTERGIDIAIQEALRSRGKIVEDQMKQKARQKTGRMARETNIATINENELVINSMAPYSRHQEYGTRKGIEPNRFMRDPIEKNTHLFQKDLVTALKEGWKASSSS